MVAKPPPSKRLSQGIKIRLHFHCAVTYKTLLSLMRTRVQSLVRELDPPKLAALQKKKKKGVMAKKMNGHDCVPRKLYLKKILGLPDGSVVENLPANARDMG